MRRVFWPTFGRTLYFGWLPTNTACCLIGGIWDHSGSPWAPDLGPLAIIDSLTFAWAYRQGQYDRILANMRAVPTEAGALTPEEWQA